MICGSQPRVRASTHRNQEGVCDRPGATLASTVESCYIVTSPRDRGAGMENANSRGHAQAGHLPSGIGRSRFGWFSLGLALVPSLVRAEGEPVVIGTAILPRDLSPWGMFLNADPIVQGVLIGLVIASIVTWTVWLAKTLEIVRARRRLPGSPDRLTR